MALVVVLAGGGTGGHISPALALAETICDREPGADVRFIGSDRGLERTHVPAAGYLLDVVPSRQVLGRGALAAVGALCVSAIGVARAFAILRASRPELVIGFGGYASVPAVVAARMLRIPTALLEPDAVPGRANRLLARFADRVFVQFDTARAHFAAGKALMTGLPVRVRQVCERAPACDGAVPRRVHLVITGGSQGARSVNRAVCGALGELSRAALHITHQTGPAHIDEVRDAYRRAGVEADVEAFFDDLPARLAAADLVLARAGANTCAELCAGHTPSILVPYPHAANDHQTENARELERAGACVLIPDDQLPARLAPEVLALAADPGRRREMATAAARRARPAAADEIWDACLALIAERKGR